jgi:hypothetical protein
VKVSGNASKLLQSWDTEVASLDMSNNSRMRESVCENGQVSELLQSRDTEVASLDMSNNSRMRDQGALALCPAIASRCQ